MKLSLISILRMRRVYFSNLFLLWVAIQPIKVFATNCAQLLFDLEVPPIEIVVNHAFPDGLTDLDTGVHPEYQTENEFFISFDQPRITLILIKLMEKVLGLASFASHAQNEGASAFQNPGIARALFDSVAIQDITRRLEFFSMRVAKERNRWFGKAQPVSLPLFVSDEYEKYLGKNIASHVKITIFTTDHPGVVKLSVTQPNADPSFYAELAHHAGVVTIANEVMTTEFYHDDPLHGFQSVMQGLMARLLVPKATQEVYLETIRYRIRLMILKGVFNSILDEMRLEKTAVQSVTENFKKTPAAKMRTIADLRELFPRSLKEKFDSTLGYLSKSNHSRIPLQLPFVIKAHDSQQSIRLNFLLMNVVWVTNELGEPCLQFINQAYTTDGMALPTGSFILSPFTRRVEPADASSFPTRNMMQIVTGALRASPDGMGSVAVFR